MPISDTVQAVIMLISGILIAIGATQIPANTPYHNAIAFAFMIAGSVGFFLKERLGAFVTGVNPPPVGVPQSSTSSGPSVSLITPPDSVDVSNLTPDG